MRSLRRFGSALFVTLLAAPLPASACGWSPEDLTGETTFDPRVAGEPDAGIYYNPYVPFSECGDCVKTQVMGEWSAHLGASVKREDWEKALYAASLADIDRLIFHLQGKQAWTDAASKPYASLLAATGDTKTKLIAALFFVGFARRVEPYAAEHSPGWVDEEPAKKPDLAAAPALEKSGEGAMKRASDPFLKQRYALQLVRLKFHQRNHAGVVAFVKEHAAMIDAPSPAVRALARRYHAGSLAHVGKGGEALLELARLFASAPVLSTAVAVDLRWVKDEHWKAAETLAKAKTSDRAALRALLALQDGAAGLAEVVKIDPASPLVPLLAVREIERAEASRTSLVDLAVVEKAVLQAVQSNGADRPWVLWLVAGHAAAIRGDVAATRERIARAKKAKPGDARVETQSTVSLVLALASSKATTSATENEMADLVVTIDRTFSRAAHAEGKARTAMGATLYKAGRRAESELIAPSIPFDNHFLGGRYEPWKDPAFVADMIAVVSKPKGSFQAYAVKKSGYTVERLEWELAMMHVRMGNYAEAAKRLPASQSRALDADPFRFYVKDCHDCGDGETTEWTHAKVIARLAELKEQSKGSAEPAARASFELANAVYNLSTWGAASHFYVGSHSGTSDVSDAAIFFERARTLSKDRELQTRAAWGAAKCEMAVEIAKARGRETYSYDGQELAEMPIPAKSFPAVKALKGTKFYEEILAECGHFRTWAGE